MTRGQKPSVFQVGEVWEDGDAVVVAGWGLGLCAAACSCHRHPSAGNLVIDEDQGRGLLGLVSFAEDGCDCCEPWTADELAAVLRDLGTLSGMGASEPLAG